MPRYDFRCNKCGRQFEVSMSMKDREEAKIECLYCSSFDVSQIYSANVFLKGGSGSKCNSTSCNVCKGCK